MEVKLNIGAWNDSLPGWTAVDKYPQSDNVLKCDLDSLPWPWPDASVDELRLWNVLEHLQPHPYDVLRECWRVLKPGGKIHGMVPTAMGRSAAIPGHIHLFSRDHFYFLDGGPCWSGNHGMRFRTDSLLYRLGWEEMGLRNPVVIAAMKLIERIGQANQVAWEWLPIIPPVLIEWHGTKKDLK